MSGGFKRGPNIGNMVQCWSNSGINKKKILYCATYGAIHTMKWKQRSMGQPLFFLRLKFPSVLPALLPFHSQEWSTSNFPCSLTSNITSNSWKNSAFHSLLRCKMAILTNSHYLTYTFLFERLGECTLSELESESVKRPTWTASACAVKHWVVD